MLVDGLWLLRRSSIRGLFKLSIFLECSIRNRLQRRMGRDLISRGRTSESVQRQFWTTVQPMHKRFVAPQRQWANLVLRGNWGEPDARRIAEKIRLMES
jgi:uridine kinase